MQTETPALRKLEDSRWEIESGGLKNLPWKPDADNPLAPPVLDMNWLVAQPLLPVLVQVAPAHTLYRSLLAHGLEDSLEVLEWIRGEQLQRVLDFDLFAPSADLGTDDIVLPRALEWIRAWLEIGPEFAAARVLELEEEVIVALVSKLYEIRPDGLTGSKEEEPPDDFFATPDRRFHLRVREGGEEEQEIAMRLMQAIYGRDVRLASQVFAYAAMLVRQESLEEGLKWRRGRLADQGFVEPHEARAMLRARDASRLRADVAVHVKRGLGADRDEAERRRKYAKTYVAYAEAGVEPETFDAVVRLLRDIDPEEGYRYVTALLAESEVRRIVGASAPSPELAMEDEELLNEAAERAVVRAKAILSNAFAGNLADEDARSRLLVERAIAHLAEGSGASAAAVATGDEVEDEDAAYGVPSVSSGSSASAVDTTSAARVRSAREGLVIDLKGRIARVSNALAAAFSPGDFLSGETFDRALGVTRGTLNVGLEIVLAAPAEWSLSGVWEDSEFEEAKAAHALELIGPEFLFQIGWQRLLAVTHGMADAVVELYTSKPGVFGFLKAERMLTLEDGKNVPVTLDRLVEAGRFVDVRKWLDEVEAFLPAPAFWVLSASLNRVPLFPEAFESETRRLRPYAHVGELRLVESFVASLASNLGATP